MQVQAKPLADQISDLILKREINKCEIFDKEALRMTRKERFLRYGEHTSIADRVTLDAELAHLEADRQRSKVELLKLKQLARNTHSTKLVELLMEALAEAGLAYKIAESRIAANDALRYEGLYEAYSASL